MNLDRAFVGLRYGLDLAVQEKGDLDVFAKCRVLVEEAYNEYQSGRNLPGHRKLEQVEALLKKVRTR